MTWLLRIVGWLFGWHKDAQEFWDRFIVPQIERARAAGIAPERIKELVDRAFTESDGEVIYPRGRLRDLIDQEIEAQP